MKHKHWLVLYDIREPKRLQAVAKLVEQFATRVQKSVFEYHGEAYLMDALQRKLKAALAPEDLAAIVPLCEQDWQKAERYGKIEKSNFINEPFAIL